MRTVIGLVCGFILGAITMLNFPVRAAEYQSSGEKLCYALVAAKLVRTCGW